MIFPSNMYRGWLFRCLLWLMSNSWNARGKPRNFSHVCVLLCMPCLSIILFKLPLNCLSLLSCLLRKILSDVELLVWRVFWCALKKVENWSNVVIWQSLWRQRRSSIIFYAAFSRIKQKNYDLFHLFKVTFRLFAIDNSWFHLPHSPLLRLDFRPSLYLSKWKT